MTSVRGGGHAWLLWLLMLCSLAGCARQAGVGEGTTAIKLPPTLDARSYTEGERAYRRLPAADPQRGPLRDKLIDYLVARAALDQAAEEYEGAVEKLAAITSLYRPEELAPELNPAIAGLASYIRARGERRGDEGRVLAALWVQKQLNAKAGKKTDASEQYNILRRWSDESRKDLGGVTEHLTGLIDVMEEHARLTPAPEVLAALADLYLERRQKLVATLGPDGQSPPAPGELSFQDYREATVALSRAPLDLAAIYLMHDDYPRALARLRQLDTVTGLEPRIRTVVEMVVEDKAEAPDALLALSRAYLEAEESDVTRALCNYGVRKYEKDGRFSQCLGRLAAARDDYAEAALDYADAIRLAPDQRELYDEALEVLANLMRGELFDSDPSETRILAVQARSILAERVKRWPSAPPPVSLDELELAVGLAEMSAGNSDEARLHFEASLKRRETTRALVQLGQLAAREGKREEALRYLRRALERTNQRDGDQARQRAQILEQLGDVARSSGDREAARRYYAEALLLWNASVDAKEEGPVRAFAHIRRGVLLSRLGRTVESLDAFELGMQAAPGNREAYAQVLSHLVVSEPNPELAAATVRRAQRQLTLDPEWKVYFGWWVRAIAARNHTAPPPDIVKLLSRMSRSEAWWGHLAEFGSGAIDYTKLRSLAQGRGEKTEADFYEGARLLGVGDVTGARAMFKRVLDSRMVGFYEYQMAQELLLLDNAALLPPAAAPAASAAAAPAAAAPTAATPPAASPAAPKKR